MFSDNFRRGEGNGNVVYAKGKEVPLIKKTRSLSLPVVAKVLEEDLEKPTAPRLI